MTPPGLGHLPEYRQNARPGTCRWESEDSRHILMHDAGASDTLTPFSATIRAIGAPVSQTPLSHTHDAACQEAGCRDIAHLVDGIRRFRTRYFEVDPEFMRNLVEVGQSPATLIISCSDSRV